MDVGFEIRIRTWSRLELRWKLVFRFVSKIGIKVQDWGESWGYRVSDLEIVRE